MTSTLADLTQVAIATSEAMEGKDYPPEVEGFMSHLHLTSHMVNKAPVDWVYRNYYDAILKESQGPVIAPLELPDGFEAMEERQCFLNAWNLATEDASLTYCEGYAFAFTIPVAHAWVERDGVIIDPTWAGRLESHEAIYLGVKVSFDLLCRLSAQTGWPSVFGGDTTMEGNHQILRHGFKMHDGIAVDLNEVRA